MKIASLSLALAWLATWHLSPCDAFWSYSSGNQEEDADGVLVSPIINRELQVSVKAHSWPSTVANVVCEAWALVQPRWSFLDTWVETYLADQQDDGDGKLSSKSYQAMTDLVLQVASTSEATSNIELLQYSLLMRSKSPTCELHRGLAEQTLQQLGVDTNGTALPRAFAIVHPHGKMAKSPSDLLELLACSTEDECQVQNMDDLLLPGEVPRSDNVDQSNTGLVILYASMISPEFAAFYQKLVELDAPFVVRHMGGTWQDGVVNPTILQGYGVRLDIRNVEYKVFDDRKGGNDDAANEMARLNASSLSATSQHFLAGVNLTALGLTDDSEPMDAGTLKLQEKLWKVHEEQGARSQLVPPTWRRRQLSVQAAHVLMQADGNSMMDPLVTLEEISQNLPSIASTLVHVKVPEETVQLVEQFERPLQQLIQESGGGLWINGRPISIERPSFNVFELIELLQKEEKELRPLQEKLGKLFSDDARSDALQAIYRAWLKGPAFFEPVLDDDEELPDGADDTSIRIDVARGWKQCIIYLNDVEKDPQYRQWPRSVEQMHMAMQYNMPPSVRRNIFTALAVVDPSSLVGDGTGRPVALDLAAQLMQNQYPMRLGVLIVGQEDIDKCKEWVLSADPDDSIPCPMIESSIFGDVEGLPTEEMLKEIPVTPRLIHRLVSFATVKLDRPMIVPYHDFLIMSIAQARRQKNTSGDEGTVSALELFESHRKAMSRMGVAQPTIMEITKSLLEADQASVDSSSADIYGKAVRFAVNKGLQPGMSFINGLPLPTSDDEDANEKIGQIFMQEQQYIFSLVASGGISDNYPRSIYGMLLTGDKVYPKVHRLFTNSDRIYTNLELQSGEKPEIISQTPFESAKAVFVVTAVLGEGASKEEFGTKLSALLTTLESQKQENANEASFGYSLVARSDLKQTEEDLPESSFLVVNGRVFSLEGSLPMKEDIELLIDLEMDKAKAVKAMLTPFITDGSSSAGYDIVSNVVGFLASVKGDRNDPLATLELIQRQMGFTENNPLRFDFASPASTGLKIAVTAIVDPVSKTAQRMAPLLKAIRDQLKMPLTVILAPKAVLDGDAKIPITSYYRFVADPSAYQDCTTGTAPMAHFSNLPTDHILTLQLDVPEPWNVQQTNSVQDTDNLRCDLTSGCSDEEHLQNAPYAEISANQRHLTEVEYGLSSLMFFGQCYEVKGNISPTNGLQLTLSPNTELGIAESSGKEMAHYSDTLVMKTAGYWQLRGNPGIWNLNILKNSRGAEIFNMIRGTFRRGNLKLAKGDDITYSSKRLVMDSFVSRGEVLLVRRKPGYEKATLFYDKNKDETEDDTVHVFSLATGHLYERFLKIMMLSVTKRTSTKVKFWLFENFLSPSFKSSAQAMADRIGCEVEFVTYKWPEFLRGQTEKQRIIWGYKILFLDVLFPLNLKKIIYVDADQVVRGDLKELWDMDLQGAPYGYTPMCSSRDTTTGFQFWNSGFWKNHLQGKPYHISALYVVDLERFRKGLVGDQLRSVYQQLSADPGSLANLDQDLPNFAQHQVPIFSLPQEWLWCESWCSDETKEKAKTIDLCNNPLHKEAKVSMAKRIISGNLFNESWVELDAEVETYYQDFLQSST